MIPAESAGTFWPSETKIPSMSNTTDKVASARPCSSPCQSAHAVQWAIQLQLQVAQGDLQGCAGCQATGTHVAQVVLVASGPE